MTSGVKRTGLVGSVEPGDSYPAISSADVAHTGARDDDLGRVNRRVVGTLVLTTMLRGASELRLTRIDLPFLLGTALTSHRKRAKTLGYIAHFGFGFLFALGYFAIF